MKRKMDFDPEELIAAVKKRRLLYDKADEKYSDRAAKYANWMQVASEIIENWDDLTKRDKELRARLVQSKWKNMRDNIRREINNKYKPNPGGKKKRQYRYYKQLAFLIPLCQETDSISKFKTPITKDDDDDDDIEEIVTPLTRTKRRSPSNSPKYKVVRSIPNKIPQTPEPIVNVTEPKPSNSWTDENEVRDFCRSLVPSLSKLDDEDRLSAKIEILNVLRKFSTPKHLRINNATVIETRTFNTFQQSSNMEQINSRNNPLSPLSAQDMPVDNASNRDSDSLLRFDICNVKSDIEDD